MIRHDKCQAFQDLIVHQQKRIETLEKEIKFLKRRIESSITRSAPTKEFEIVEKENHTIQLSNLKTDESNDYRTRPDPN